MRAATPRATAASAPHYQRRRPEQTPLYRLVRAHYETFAAEVGAHGAGLPPFVKEEFEAYLECGILAYGFLRLTCDTQTRGQALTIAHLPCENRRHGPSPQN
jgi:hypothetical protein